MSTLAEPAYAKVNLSLRVHGRRADGYHELESLVVFAAIGDRVSLTPCADLSLEVTGPGALPLASGGGQNLIIAAAEAARAREPGLALGRFVLEKHLPVAAGVGGGSADAAAALRLVARANPRLAGTLDWMAIGASIGADVPVCFVGRPALMSGLGERVVVLDRIAAFAFVLANPRLPLATADVFRALGAPSLSKPPPTPSPPDVATLDALLAYLAAHPNDLEPVARRLCPAVAEVQSALSRLDGARLVRMSGSGPTCFALFEDQAAAERGARRLASSHSGWWIEAAPRA